MHISYCGRTTAAAITLTLLAAVTGCGAETGSTGARPSAASSPPAAPAPAAAGTAPPSPTLATARGWLAYQGFGDDGDEDAVILTRVDGSDEHQIATEVPGLVAHPDFSRDGARLAFDQRDGDSSTQVYVADADGLKSRPIATCRPPTCAEHHDPAWSPDGRQLAIAWSGDWPDPAQPPRRFGLGIIDVETGTVRTIVDHEAATGQDLFPRWSPDGTRLVFWRTRENNGGWEMAVFVASADGSGPLQLTEWSEQAGDPDWSPTGDRIVYSTHPLFEFPDAGHSELVTIRPDGTGRQALTSFGPDGPRATQPRWTPDGSAILYTRTTQSGQPRHIYALVPGGVDSPIATKRSIYTHPVLQPHPA